MTAAAPRFAVAADHALLSAYVEHCQRLGLSDRAYRDRQRIARAFLTDHPDVPEWMQLPTQHRVLELRRTGAWPLLAFAIGAGQVALDVELAMTKHLQGLGAIVEEQHRGDFAAARGAGLALHWTDGWVETVLHECLAVVLAWLGGPLSALNADVLQRFQDELEDTPTVPPSSLRAYRARRRSARWRSCTG